MIRIALTFVATVLLGGCQGLPEPESAGAKLYQRRCVGCHRLYRPETMTADMWTLQVDRMQGEFTRRGMRPLSADERSVLLDYLFRNSHGRSEG